MLMPVTTRANAAPADQKQRMLARLFPNAFPQGTYGGMAGSKWHQFGGGLGDKLRGANLGGMAGSLGASGGSDGTLADKLRGMNIGGMAGSLPNYPQPPKSPTGLPIYTPPPPPRPTSMGTQAEPGAVAPAVAPAPTPAPAPATQPMAPSSPDISGRMAAPTAGIAGAATAKPQGEDLNNPARFLSPENQQKLSQYWQSLGEGADYKGSLAAQHMMYQQYLQMLLRQQNAPPIDYSGGAQIGQYFDRARSRQTAMDAAMGRSGGGVGAAGQSALYGQQGSAVADMVRQLLEQRRQEQMAQEDWMRNLQGQVDLKGLDRVFQKEDSPKWWQQALGPIGSIAGTALGGPVGGAIGGAVGGAFSGNNAGVNTQPLGDMGSFGAGSDPIAALFQKFQQPDQLDPFGQYGQ